MPTTKIKSLRLRKKKSASKRKKISPKPKTSSAVVNKMSKLLDKNEIKIDDIRHIYSRHILKKNIDKLVEKINNDPNITKEEKARIIFELSDISKTYIDLNNPEDYSKLNDLYRRFDKIIKQLDDISLRTGRKLREFFDLVFAVLMIIMAYLKYYEYT